MNIQANVRYLLGKLVLSDFEKKYLDKKTSKIENLFKYLKENELQIEVELGQDKRGLWRAEFMIKTPFRLYRSEKKQSKSFTEAVDLAEKAAIGSIRRDQEKSKERGRKLSRDEKLESLEEMLQTMAV